MELFKNLLSIVYRGKNIYIYYQLGFKELAVYKKLEKVKA